LTLDLFFSFDIGPIVSQKSVDLPSPNMTSFKLLDYLGNMGSELIMDIFKDFPNKMREKVPQSETNVSYGNKIDFIHSNKSKLI